MIFLFLRFFGLLSQLTLINIEPGAVLFKVDGLHCQVYLDPTYMQSLHMKVSQPPPGPSPDGKQPYQWNPDDLQV